MKTSHTILAIALSVASFGGAAYAVSSTDSAIRASMQTETWLKIPAIYNRVIAAGYGDINEIEREDRGYEVEARNANGDRVELYVDAVTGEILKSRVKDD
ncbi:MAG: PepSY domain-containing protein [Gammaproteobacteria bacterium]|nr:PepSY domain-containing protein [Gammaproteobacteria bacterium]